MVSFHSKSDNYAKYTRPRDSEAGAGVTYRRSHSGERGNEMVDTTGW